MRVWEGFLESYNGRSCCQEAEGTNHDVDLYMDAAGSKGFGAEWCAEAWPSECDELGLSRNLVIPGDRGGVVGPKNKVCFWSDNMGVVNCLNLLTSSSLPVLALLRDLVLRYLQYNIWFRSHHVPGNMNKIADALLRFHWQEFRDLLPGQLWSASRVRTIYGT